MVELSKCLLQRRKKDGKKVSSMWKLNFGIVKMKLNILLGGEPK